VLAMGLMKWSAMKPQHAAAAASVHPDAFVQRVHGQITPAEYIRALDERIAARRANARLHQRKR
jgi:hypothetical protein